MQRRSSQLKTQLMQLRKESLKKSWAVSLIAMIFFAFISSFCGSNIAAYQIQIFMIQMTVTLNSRFLMLRKKFKTNHRIRFYSRKFKLPDKITEKDFLSYYFFKILVK